MKIQNNYHDAILSEIRICDNELMLVADLDGHWNNKCVQRACLIFHNVKNLPDVCRTLGLKHVEGKHSFLDEIIGVLKADRRTYLVDLARTQSLKIECQGLSEV